LAIRTSIEEVEVLARLGRSVSELQLKDLGWHRLRDIPEPERILQLMAKDLPMEFSALNSRGTPTNLSPAATPIIGCDGELVEISSRMMAR